MNNGASVDAVSYSGNSALHLAAARGHTAIVRILLNAGSSKSALNEYEETPYDVICTTEEPENTCTDETVEELEALLFV